MRRRGAYPPCPILLKKALRIATIESTNHDTTLENISIDRRATVIAKSDDEGTVNVAFIAFKYLDIFNNVTNTIKEAKK